MARPALRALLFPIVLGACTTSTGGDIPVVGDADAIDAYLRELPFLPTMPPGVNEGDRTTPAREGDYQCVRQNLSETRQFDRIVAYAANSDSLWPGAIVAGESVYSGLFSQVGFERRPLTISVSLENLVGAKSATLEHPSLSSFREALTGILDSDGCSSFADFAPRRFSRLIEIVAGARSKPIWLNRPV